MLNRPKLIDYAVKVFEENSDAMYGFDTKAYEQALNIYIDQLEKQNDEITKAYYDVINTFGKELYKREKAFNNCYDVLVNDTIIISRKVTEILNKEGFRKWCEEHEE